MFHTGLVSVSFRGETPADILDAMRAAGLDRVEWGSDIHAPCADSGKIDALAALTREKEITCCSYGTYFRLGVTPIGELFGYIAAAKRLGTNVLRLWCGDRGASVYAEDDEALLELRRACREAAKIAEEEGVTLCLECHNGTLTDDCEAALWLMDTVSSSALRMYWQPNQFVTFEKNLAYARAIAPYVRKIHVFTWRGNDKFPLSDGEREWREYLSVFPGAGDIDLLLEFMPDGKITTLAREAETLKKWIGEMK